MKAMSRRLRLTAPCQIAASARSARLPTTKAARRSRRAAAARDGTRRGGDAAIPAAVTAAASRAALADMGVHHDQHADVPDADLVDDDRPAIGVGLREC